MVFCYKVVTESPGQYGSTPPRTISPSKQRTNVSDRVSRDGSTVLDLIPDRDWRLLAALARKRDELDERERLAEAFQKMWMKEKEDRETVEAELSAEYNRFLHEKRRQERCYQQYKRCQRAEEMQARRGHLLDWIQHKEMRSADMLALKEDQKIAEMLDKVLDEGMRAQLAAERRSRLEASERMKKQSEMVHGIRKANDAGVKRNTMLREASKRLAINRALSDWETTMIRQDVAVEEAVKRAHALARSEMADARARRVKNTRAARTQRARALAAVSAHLRELIKRDR